MDGIKIIHCADLHIGATLGTLGTKADIRAAEALGTLGRIVAECKERNTDLLLIAGDLFDSSLVPQQTLSTIRDFFASVPNTKIAIVPGNHDYLSADSPYMQEFGENVHIFRKPEYITVCGKRVYGIPFLSAHSSTFALPKTQEGGILLMHGDTSGGNYNPISEEALSSTGMDYIALGHIHKYSGIKRAGSVCFAYPGCPEPLGFDEEGEKGVIVGTIGRNECNLSFLPLCKRQYKEIRLDVSECIDTGDILAKAYTLLANEKDNLIKLTLTGGCDFYPDINFIRASLEDKIFFIKVSPETHRKENLEILKKEQSLKGFFVKNMLSLIEKADEDEKEKLLYSLQLGLDAIDGREALFDDN